MLNDNCQDEDISPASIRTKQILDWSDSYVPRNANIDIGAAIWNSTGYTGYRYFRSE